MKIEEFASFDLSEVEDEKLRESLGSLQTLAVRPDDSALEVAKRFNDEDGGIIILVDASGAPQAILDPQEIQNRLHQNMSIQTASFRDALEKLAENLIVPGPLKDLLKTAYRPHWCAPGRHYTNPPRCRVHE